MDVLKKYSLNILQLRRLNALRSSTLGRILAISWLIVDVTLLCSTVYYLLFLATDAVDSADSISVIIVICQTITKQLSLLIYHKQYAEICSTLEKFWPYDQFGTPAKTKLDRIQTIVEKVLFSYTVAIVSTLFFYYLRPILQREKVLMMGWVIFCDLESNLCYAFNYAAQVIWTAWLLPVFFVYDTMIFLLLGRGYCELEQIKYGFTDLKVHEDESEVLKQVSVLVKHHNLVLDYLQKICNLLNIILLCFLLTILASLCTSFFLLTATGFPPSIFILSRIVPYLIGSFGQNLLYCIAGQIISDQSVSVADAAYNSKWYTSKSFGLRKAICLVIQRSQRPIQLAAGGSFDMNLGMFVTVTKASTSALAFLNSVRD